MPNITLIINTVNAAPSQFTNHIANDFSVFDEKLLFTTEDGLYEYGGDNDGYEDIDGVSTPIPINAYFSLPVHDFGYQGEKSPRSLLLEGSITGDIAVDLLDENGVTKTYLAEELDGADGMKVGLDTDQRSRYMQFTFKNVDGSYFSIDAASMVFIPGAEARK